MDRCITTEGAVNLHVLVSLGRLTILSLLFSGTIWGSPPETSQLRPFTIKDSIEISYFVNPSSWTVNLDRPPEPIISPDRRWFLLITQRGVLASNTLESTIWMFNRQSVSDFAWNKSPKQPVPKAVAICRAVSNTPVLSDVRWLEDSRRVAFLGKMSGGSPQLYVADSRNGAVKRLTKGAQPVSAFDIRGGTIAYTTLDDIKKTAEPRTDLVDVTGKSIWTLLWRDRAIGDRDEALLLNIPNTLHIMRKGRDLTTLFTFNGRPLKLFFPVLSLSPDGKSLITIAPVPTIPLEWKTYQPRFGYENLRLDPANSFAIDPENAWKPSEFVKIDLKTGIATPLLGAPAGRSLFHIFAPTKAMWSPDSRRVLVTDTFLPLLKQDSSVSAARAAAPAAVIIDLLSQEIQLIAFLPQPVRDTPAMQHVSDIIWNGQDNQVEMAYASTPDNVPIAFHETYRWTDAGWARTGTSSVASDRQLRLVIDQDLNEPPVLAEHLPNVAQPAIIWDPNPQLASVALGTASLYQWHDKDGNSRSGILALPADYVAGKRYPLVIQTHGFEPKKFFTDGIYTTGSGGRALCGRGIIVLQVDQFSKSTNAADDGPLQTEGFRSAIQQLARDGLADPERVGVIGFSFTVFHVLYAITHSPNLFAAATITDGNDLSYWLYLLWTDIPFAQQLAEAANGGLRPFGKEGLSRWAESAPGFNLDRVRTPVLISCLEKGTLVATWDIYGGLRTLGKPVDMVWLEKEDAPHVLVQPRQRYLSQQGAVEWFDFWLNGREDPRPEKAEQYARWRELRKLKSEQQNKTEIPAGN